MGCVKLQSLDPESTVFTPPGRGVRCDSVEGWPDCAGPVKSVTYTSELPWTRKCSHSCFCSDLYWILAYDHWHISQTHYFVVVILLFSVFFFVIILCKVELKHHHNKNCAIIKALH